jgi:hypothetical protein
MDESPLAVLAPKDRGHAQADIVHDVATANATTQVLDLEEIPEVVRMMRRDGLGPDDLTI